MNPYPSIETVYVRNKDTNRLDFGANRMPETEHVRGWTISEKIDGTNIRAIVTMGGIEVRGRTDKAQLPSGLEDAVRRALPSHEELVWFFTEYRGKELPETWSVTFYGEGYGPGIQNGAVYSDRKRFRVFDLKLGENLWVADLEMRRVCAGLGIPTAPLLTIEVASHFRWPVMRVDLDQMFKYLPAPWTGPSDVFGGSIVAKEDRGVAGVQPEGIVAKPLVVLLDAKGNRVMWKLTYREFPAEMEVAA